MVSLKKFLNTTRSKVDSIIYGGERRPYLGMSGIGFHCNRYLWLSFHWCLPSTFTARTDRIFSLGHLFEEIIIKQLKNSGMDIYKIIDGERVEHFGKMDEPQETYVGFEKYVFGHSDGRIKGIPEAPEIEHILEIKTMKESFFKELCKSGIKKGHSTYYGQSQRYMKETGLEWALFVVINKNTSHLYFERIKFDPKFAQELKRKEINIVMTDIIPENPYKKGFYKCDLCFGKHTCYGDIQISKTCRSCVHCDIEGGGKWGCSLQDNKILSVDEQRIGCDKYQLGWGLEK